MVVIEMFTSPLVRPDCGMLGARPNCQKRLCSHVPSECTLVGRWSSARSCGARSRRRPVKRKWLRFVASATACASGTAAFVGSTGSRPGARAIARLA